MYTVVSILVLFYHRRACQQESKLHIQRATTAAEVVLFLSPLAFIGDLNNMHCRMSPLWSFAAPLIRVNFSNERHDWWWRMWIVLYVGMVVGVHSAIHVHDSLCLDADLNCLHTVRVVVLLP